MPEYLYHVTSNATASVHIKQHGLIPEKFRTGRNAASDVGSFSAEKKENFDSRVMNRLAGLVSESSKSGFSADEIFKIKFNFQLKSIDTETSRDFAVSELDSEKKRFIRDCISTPNKIAKPSISIPKAKTLIKNLIVKYPNSDLYCYAKECIALEYDIEKNETAKHVYFFQNSGGEGNCFLSDYSRFHGGISNCRVLRVEKSDIRGLKRDLGESRGYMTEERVLNNVIEIYELGMNPFIDNKEDSEKRWRKISDI
ncbi:hypothetical protein [Serratia marcescens]|uniref:hypothetical protein n=2 Tax=Serratia marcescens TaxID=615 RepID=UPI000F0C3CD7|nr:hypothetical protein [Serratia marcescens]BBG67269.1 hypothetical protein SERAS_00720 [Serratia marcescens]